MQQDFLTQFNNVLSAIDNALWGFPLIVLIMAGGIILTARLKVVQFRKLGKALRYMIKNEEDGEGEVTSFGALCTALSATIGTGNIVGVATAICAGGPGALFWMFVAACLGMATKFSEGLLAIKYRTVSENGRVLGGPFYYIERGMGKNWKWLAKCFAAFGALAGLLGIGTFTQINSINSATNNFFDPNSESIAFSMFGMDYTWTTVIASLIVAILVGLIIIGGLKRIANVTQVVVPAMVVLYLVICFMVLFGNITYLPEALSQIIIGAFDPMAVTGGAIGSFMIAMQMGVARGIFSNESGMGSAPIAAAAAKTNEPVRQGLVSMTGTFIDTIIVCSMTGISIVMSGAWDPSLGLEGSAVTTYAFQNGIPFLPSEVVTFCIMLCLALFGFTTIIGWNYYAERCVEYLFNGNMKFVKVFHWLFIVAVFVGPYMTLDVVWTLADIFNGCMALPNMIALIALSKVISKETKDYFDRLSRGEIKEFADPVGSKRSMPVKRCISLISLKIPKPTETLVSVKATYVAISYKMAKFLSVPNTIGTSSLRERSMQLC